MENITKLLVNRDGEIFTLFLSENYPISLNYSVAQISDITKRGGNYSKTLQIPGTPQNNEAFNDLFDIQSTLYKFDLTKKYECILYTNDVEQFRGYIVLNNIIKNPNSNHFQDNVNIIYNCTIFSTTIDLFTTIADKNLDDLQFGKPKHQLYRDTILSFSANTYLDTFKYFHHNNLGAQYYTEKDFYPSIFTHSYIKNIINTAGYHWDNTESSFMESEPFTKLVTPYAGSINVKTIADWESEKFLGTEATSAVTRQTLICPNSGGGSITHLFNFTDYTTYPNFYNQFSQPVGGVYTISGLNGQQVINVKLKGEIMYSSSTSAWLSDVDGMSMQQAMYYYVRNGKRDLRAVVKKNGSPVATGVATINCMPIQTTYSETNPDILAGQIYKTNVDVTIPVNVQNLSIGDEVQVYVDFWPFPTKTWFTTNGSFGSVISWPVGTVVNPRCALTLSASTWWNTPVNVATTSVGDYIDIQNYIPKNIKQTQYMSEVFKIFNLYIDESKEFNKRVIIKTRDEYYNTPIEWDWSDKIDRGREIKIEYLTDLTKRKTILKYKDGSDEYTKKYKEYFNTSYGEKQIIYDSEILTGEEKKEFMFSSAPLINNNDIIVPAISTITPPNDLYLLYDGGLIDGHWHFRDSRNGSSGYSYNQYNYCGHFDNPNVINLDLNFGECAAYFIDNSLGFYTDNNLFNLYHYNTYKMISEKKMMTAYFFIDEDMIGTLKLSDKIKVNGVKYIINAIKDYNPTNKNSTLVELVEFEDIYTKPRQKKRPIRISGQTVTNVTKPLLSTNLEAQNNTNFVGRNTRNVNITGIFNTIEGSDVSVVGDGNIIEGSKLKILGNNWIVTGGTENSIFIGDSKGQVISGDTIYLSNTNIINDSKTFTVNSDVIVFSSQTVTFNNTPLSSITASVVWTTGSTGTASIRALNSSNVDATANYAVAEGYDTLASGTASHAEGYSTIAGGSSSHAEGSGTTAIGDYSHAEGISWDLSNINISYGVASHTEGFATKTYGEYSHAEGQNTQSIGKGSHSEGAYTIATGETSHAEGSSTKANGFGSHSEGAYTIAIGDSSHAEGQNTKSNGDYSHSEGGYTTATGYTSHAEGRFTTSNGDYSHTEGYRTKSNNYYSHAEGYYTIASGTSSHSEGYYTTANKDASHSEGYYTIANGLQSHSEGGATKTYGDFSHSEGNQTIASGNSSHSEGNQTIASGNSSHTEGSGTTTIGEFSHSEGSLTISSGKTSHSEGYYTTANGEGSHSEGYYTQANGNYSNSKGYNTITYGNYSNSKGEFTIASGCSSHAEGGFTTANSCFSHSEGYYTIANGEASHAEGSGTTTNALFSHAEGIDSVANGIASHAEGRGTTASGSYSHSGGLNNKATGTGTAVIAANGITGSESYTLYTDNLRVTNSISATSISASTIYTHTISGMSQVNINDVIIEDGNILANSISGDTLYSGSTNLYDIFATSASVTPTYVQPGLNTYTGGTAQQPSVNISAATLNNLHVTAGTYSNTVSALTFYQGALNLDSVYSNVSHQHSDLVSVFLVDDSQFMCYQTSCLVTGDYAFAEGYNTTASKKYAHSEGESTTANGQASHAEGGVTYASGDYSHSEGSGTIASGNYSHAGGTNCISSGLMSFSHANDSEAAGQGSAVIAADGVYGANDWTLYTDNIIVTYGVTALNFVSGSTNLNSIFAATSHNHTNLTNVLNVNTTYSSVYQSGCTATGTSCFAEGFSTLAARIYSHAEGSYTISSGSSSHAEGSHTTSYGIASHAEGGYSVAAGARSHAEGSDTTATGNYCHAEGYNTTANGQASHSEGSVTYASGDYSHAEGNQTYTKAGSSHAEGYKSYIDLSVIFSDTNHASHVEGYECYIKEYIAGLGNYVNGLHAEGYKVSADTVNNYGDHIEGCETGILPSYGFMKGNHVEGYKSKIDGLDITYGSFYGCHVEGHSCVIPITNSYDIYGNHAEGYLTTASGKIAAHAEGRETVASGNYSHAGGYNTKATGTGTAVIAANGITGSENYTLYTDNLRVTSSVSAGTISASTAIYAAGVNIGRSYITLPVSMVDSSFSPTDGAKYYFGNAGVSTTAATSRRIFIFKAGTIRIAQIWTYASTVGTNENISMYIRKNNSTDTLIETVGAAAAARNFDNASLAITVASGDYIEVKMVCPSWATNPVFNALGGYIVLETFE